MLFSPHLILMIRALLYIVAIPPFFLNNGGEYAQSPSNGRIAVLLGQGILHKLEHL
jgi:hypothetical protein